MCPCRFSGWVPYGMKKEESLKFVGIPGFFMELLARFVCIRARECARIKVRLRRAVAGGARPRRI